MPPSEPTESRSTWKSIAYLLGLHGGSISSGLGAIIGGLAIAPCATPIGPRGLIHSGHAASGIARAKTPSSWSAAVSGSVHSESMTEPGLQNISVRSTASE